MARIASFRRAPVRRSPPSVGGSDTAARPWPVQADSLLRPFARRRASTRRPPREAMRARKPCSRFRARFLGWYVCFAIRPCSIPLRSAIPNWRASKTHETAGACQPHAIGSWPGFRCGGFYRRLAEAVKPRRRRLIRCPLSGRKVDCYTTATPRAGCRFDGPPRAREEYDFGPLYPWRRRTGDWFIDGCEAGMARRPR